MLNNVVAIVNSKGGCGKTTTAIGLAEVLAKKSKVLVVDLDGQGSASDWADNALDDGRALLSTVAQIGLENRPASIARLVKGAAKQTRAEWVIIDTPPGNLDRTDAAIELAADAKKGLVVVPTKTSALDLPRTVLTAREAAERANTAVLFTMARSNTRRLKEAREVLTEAKIKVLRTEIPQRETSGAAAEGNTRAVKNLIEDHRPLAAEIRKRMR